VISRGEIARAAPALRLGGPATSRLLQLVEQHLEGDHLEALLEQLLVRVRVREGG